MACLLKRTRRKFSMYCSSFLYDSFKSIQVHHQVKALNWTLSLGQSAKQSSGVFTYTNTVQMYKFHFIENWNLIYKVPCVSLLLEGGSALVMNILPAAIPEEVLL